MNEALKTSFTQDHHAFCVVGGQVDEITAAACALWKVDRHGPDVWVKEADSFVLSDAHELNIFASRVSAGNAKVAIISTPQLLREAQNALLKTVEEPRGNTKIIFVIPRTECLIETIRSRVQQIRVENKHPAEGMRVSPEKFLNASPAERLKLVESFTKEKDKKGAEEFLNAVEQFAHETKNMRALRAILFVRTYIHNRGASLKLLLEYVAVNG